MQHHELYLKLKNLKQKIIFIMDLGNQIRKMIKYFIFSFSDTSHTLVEHKIV
jgi:hypothetical protein